MNTRLRSIGSPASSVSRISRANATSSSWWVPKLQHQPEFQELSAALLGYLSEITEKVVREEVHRETGEAEEIDEPARIGR